MFPGQGRQILIFRLGPRDAEAGGALHPDRAIRGFRLLQVTVQGFHVGIRVLDRSPYSRIEFKDDGAPFHFNVVLHFDPEEDPLRTDFWIEVSADLNFMMKMKQEIFLN